MPDSDSQLQKDLNLILSDAFMKKIKGNKRSTENNANQLITMNLNPHSNLNFQIKSQNWDFKFSYRQERDEIYLVLYKNKIKTSAYIFLSKDRQRSQRCKIKEFKQ